MCLVNHVAAWYRIVSRNVTVIEYYYCGCGYGGADKYLPPICLWNSQAMPPLIVEREVPVNHFSYWKLLSP